VKDLEQNVPFYFGLGIQAYLVIDGITPTSQLRKFIQLHLWRVMNGQIVKIAPDHAGRLAIPELGVSVSVWGRRLSFTELATGEPLLDNQELFNARQAEARRAETEAQRAEAEAQARQAEAQRAATAEAELARLKAFLADKGYPIP
jgi:multidrug efflux pump subunit AcrA (membrane-fusion protein)